MASTSAQPPSGITFPFDPASPTPRNPTLPPNNQADLPRLPSWFISAFAGAGVFVLIVAVVLLMVQWPQSIAWVEEWLRRRPTGDYKKAVQEDGLPHVLPFSITSDSTTAHDFSGGYANDHDSIRSLEGRRNGKNLRIDTTAKYRGLGITLAADDAAEAPGPGGLRKMFSLAPPRQPPWKTDPLPCVSSLFSGSTWHHNPERTTPGADSQAPTVRRSITASDTAPECFDSRSESIAVGKAVVRKMNQVIFNGTEKLAGVLHDPVQIPEGGLLLPIREEEREDEHRDPSRTN